MLFSYNFHASSPDRGASSAGSTSNEWWVWETPNGLKVFGETQTIAVNISSDDIVENDEQFQITLRAVSNTSLVQQAAITTGATGTGTIQNDDHALVIVGTALSPEFIYTVGPGDLMPDDRPPLGCRPRRYRREVRVQAGA